MNAEHYDRTVAAAKNIPELFFRIAGEMPDAPLYSYPRSDGGSIAWETVTYEQSAARIRAIATFLIDLALPPRSSIAIISGTRPEWMEIDLAVLAAGHVTVSIYPSLPHGDCGFILYDSGAKVVFAENEEQLSKLRTLETDETSIPPRDDLPAEKVRLSFATIVAIEAAGSHPKAVLLANILSADRKKPPALPQIERRDHASIVYTSGTTGPSKGVEQTHGNHLANVEQAVRSGMFALDGSLFLFLPLAHSFARLIGYLGFLTPAYIKFCGVCDRLSSKVDLARVAAELRDSSADVLPTVPRLFEKIRSTLEERAQAKTLQARLLALTLRTADAVYRAQIESRKPSYKNRLLYGVTAPLRRKIRRGIFGDRFRHAISGGAKMPVDVNHFFWSIGVPIYEGYGLTETCVATNVNRTGRNRIGSVGPALDGVETKIAEDGEILFRGPNVTKGYRNRPLASAESWDAEGWFHTGDVGHLDSEGFLFITDRKKDLIVTAGGKKIPPQKIENLVTQSPFISQAIYCGDGKPFCVALVTLNHGTVREALRARKIAPAEALETQKEVLELMEEVRTSVNRGLSSFEAVKKIAVIPGEFTIENGILTPTLKVKRKVALARYRELYEALYSQPGS